MPVEEKINKATSAVRWVDLWALEPNVSGLYHNQIKATSAGRRWGLEVGIEHPPEVM